jgi:hypothetical protein
MIDVDPPPRLPRHPRGGYASAHAPPVFTAAERAQQLQQLARSAEGRKRSPQNSGSPERLRGAGGGGGAGCAGGNGAACAGGGAQATPPGGAGAACGGGAGAADADGWRIAAGAAGAAPGTEPDLLDPSALAVAPPDAPPPQPPFSWTRGELVGIGAFGRVFTGLNNETGEIIAVKQVRRAGARVGAGRRATGAGRRAPRPCRPRSQPAAAGQPGPLAPAPCSPTPPVPPPTTKPHPAALLHRSPSRATRRYRAACRSTSARSRPRSACCRACATRTSCATSAPSAPRTPCTSSSNTFTAAPSRGCSPSLAPSRRR